MIPIPFVAPHSARKQVHSSSEPSNNGCHDYAPTPNNSQRLFDSAAYSIMRDTFQEYHYRHTRVTSTSQVESSLYRLHYEEIEHLCNQYNINIVQFLKDHNLGDTFISKSVSDYIHEHSVI